MTTPDEARAMLERAQVDGDLGLTAEMAARAPFMAEQIANMHYEYAVQETDRGWYLREQDDGKLTEVADPTDADWWYEQGACADYVRYLNESTGYNARVVRRLVSELEVVE